MYINKTFTFIGAGIIGAYGQSAFAHDATQNPNIA